ncbi:MAG: hypothetical protein IKM43_01685 [Clostridia bacterium]|nr:hypothetical protein [Clostridia bacterium]
MYIEKLKTQDYEEFAQSLMVKLDKIYNFSNIIVIKFKNDVYPECKLSDFYLQKNAGHDAYNYAWLERRWRRFLYKKFGDAYKKDLFDILDKKLEKQKNEIEFGQH